MASPNSLPATPAPAQTPAEDIYDIGTADLEQVEAPRTGATGEAPAVQEMPPARPVPPKDPATGQFIKKTHPAYLARQARDLGFSEDEIESMDTGELGPAVAGAMRFALESASKQDHQRATRDDQATGQGPQIDWGRDESGEALTEKHYAPTVADAIKRVHSLERRLEELESLVQRSEGARQADSAYDRMDQAFARLTELHGALGAGGRHELDPEGPELARRQAVIDQAKRMAGGDKATWQSVLQKIPAAARALFGGTSSRLAPSGEGTAPPPAPSEESLDDYSRKWANGAVARPTHRQSPPESKGRAAAIRKVQQVLRDRGQLGEEVSDEDFPD